MTAALGMYIRLGLPEPWHPAKEPLPLIIYGAASAVGYYAIQLAQRSNIHPLICVAGRARDHVESAIDRSKGDTIIDYRDGDEAVVEGFKKALGQEGLPPLMHAFDAVSEKGSYVNICQVLPKGGKITLVLPGRDYKEIPEGIEQSITSVGSVHNQSEGEKDFGFLFFRYFSRGLEKGWFKPQRHEVVPGGLGGLQGALKNLMDGKASGVKYVLRIAETEGVSR
jgi:NADPH:quinone reductase-like Zn-dependent oxidoreductase